MFFFSGRNLGSSCPLGTFRCLGNDSEIGVCLPRRLLCDNRPDCPDGSDEDPLKCCELLFIRVRFFTPLISSAGRAVKQIRAILAPEWGQSIAQRAAAVSRHNFFLFYFIVPASSTSSCPLHASLIGILFFFFFLSFPMRIIADNYGELQSFVNVVSENPAPESTTVPATVSPFFANCCELSVDIHQSC